MPPRRAAQKGLKTAKVIGQLLKVKVTKNKPTPRDESDEDSTRGPTSPEASDHEVAPVQGTSKGGKKTTTTTTTTTPQVEDADIPTMEKTKKTKKRGIVLTEEQEVAMGEWIRDHPHLFTKSLKLYKDIAKKTKLWDDKAKELDIEPESLRTWYESIRSRVGKLTGKSGSATVDATMRDTFIRANFGFLTDHIARVRGRTAQSVSIK